MTPDDDDPEPVIDTRRILDTDAVTRTVATNDEAIRGKPRDAAARATPKPKIPTLFVYDKNDPALTERAPVLADAFYRGATMVAVSSWAHLVSTLSRYSEIERLALFFHASGGTLILRSDDGSERQITPDVARDRLAASGVHVTQAIRFEGCSIMSRPHEAAMIVSKISGADAIVSGYTYYTILKKKEIKAANEAEAEKILKAYAGYWLPNAPSAAQLFAHTYKFGPWLRWFTSVYSLDPLPDPATLSGPDRRGLFAAFDDLHPKTLSTREHVTDFLDELANSVGQGFRVTVTDIQTVAGWMDR